MGVSGGKGSLTQALASVGASGGMRSMVGRGAASSVFATQVATGRGIIGAGASLGALGTGAIVAAGAFGVLAAAIGLVAYKAWKMRDVHNAVIEDLEKKEKYRFPAIEQLNAALRESYDLARSTKTKLDELTLGKKLIDQTGQQIGVLSDNELKAAGSTRAWASVVATPRFLKSDELEQEIKDNTYFTETARQDNIKEALTTLARQDSDQILSSFYGDLGKQRSDVEINSFLAMLPKTYKHDYAISVPDLREKLYSEYDEKTGEGMFVYDVAKEMTVGEGVHTGPYKQYINNVLYPELKMRAEAYRDIISSPQNAQETLAAYGFDFDALQEMGFKRNDQEVWEQAALPANAKTGEKEQHLTNSRTVHQDLIMLMTEIRKFWGNSGEIAENFLRAAGFPSYMFSNEPDRNDMAPWNRPGISSPAGDDDGAGGNYSGTGKLSSAAPKQVIVNITNLLSVDTIELLKSDNGKLAEIQDLKEQMAEALISVVHDFDASWNGN